MFKVLHLRHHSEPVASPNLDNILLAIFAAQQLEGEIDEFRRVGEPPDAAVSIKVGTQTYVVDTHHIDGMLKMGDSVHDVGFTLFTQESMIERGMSHTTLCCEGTHLVIGQITGHIAERTAAAMAANNRRLADIMDAIAHLEHAIDVMGIDHVGLGTDFDGDGGIRGLADSSELINFTLQLLRRKYSEQDIVKIWGGNWLRVMTQVQNFGK